jgi:hypothetical protein
MLILKIETTTELGILSINSSLASLILKISALSSSAVIGSTLAEGSPSSRALTYLSAARSFSGLN